VTEGAAGPWADFKRRKRNFWALYLVYVPILGGFGLGVVKPMGWDERWLLLPFWIWLGAWIGAGGALSRTPCPICGRAFFLRRLPVLKLRIHYLWANTCCHCRARPPWKTASGVSQASRSV
jgi:hypothetical protein